jgi:SAM-dependent methyltransferase
MHEYDDAFYRYISEGAAYAAAAVAPALEGALGRKLESVLDVGCGAGAWLSVWRDRGATVCGLDGDYVNRRSLLITPEEFSVQDLRQPFDLQQRFDLVQCLEVAEHLPAEVSAGLVACLCRHSDLVMFSAAPPGQGGENHVNEQTYEFWRDRFAEQGYRMYDPIRRAIGADAKVKPWYRYNIFVYVKENTLDSTHRALATCRVANNRPPADLSPRLYRLRKRLVRLLPVAAMTGMAMAKKTLANAVVRGSP